MTFEGSELDTPLLTKRSKSLLKEMDITTIDQLTGCSYRAFLNRYGYGKGTLENIIAFLKVNNRVLKEMPEVK
jgi:hypothetical protein